MGLDVSIYDKNIIINENAEYNFEKYKEVNYIGGRFEPYQTIASVILHTREMQKQYQDIEYGATTDKNANDTQYHYHKWKDGWNKVKCNHPYECFSKYGLNNEINKIIEEVLDDNPAYTIETENYIIEIG